MPHCLSALVRDPHGPLGLFNQRTGRPIATRLIAAFDSASRRQGLLGRDGLDVEEAIVLAPCSSIHTAFMRFALDLVFLDRAGTVLKVSRDVQPWRIRLTWRAFAVVELASGGLVPSDTKPGDVIELRTIV